MKKHVKKFKALYLRDHLRHWAGILALMAFSVAGLQLNYNMDLLLTSTLEPTHAPFDGTVLPVQVIPDWSNLSSAEYNMEYHDIPTEKLIPTPTYNDIVLTFPSKDLVWGDPEHNVIRNTKITYSVPWLGNYELDDCGRYCGSHPAVDIKVPQYTPVHNMANGIVVKKANSSSWGLYVTVKHEGVPHPTNPSQLTTVYITHAHLSNAFVNEGQEVLKSEIIGEVGHSGTATTNHLHVQGDYETAPWSPYWPFTSTEASNAGYSFWEAVSAGVGQDNAMAHTFDVIEWAQTHADYSGTSTLASPSTLTESTTSAEEVTVEETVEVVEEVIEEVSVVEEEVLESTEEEAESTSAVITVDFDAIEVDTQDFYMTGQNRSFDITLMNGGEVVTDTDFNGEISISLSNPEVGTVNRAFLEPNDFNNGVAELSFYAEREGDLYLTFNIGEHVFYSPSIYVIEEIQPFAKFGVASDGYFQVGWPETVQIQTLDLTGDPTPDFKGNGTVELEVIEGNATLSKYALEYRDFSSGLAEVEMTANTDETVTIRVTYGNKTAEGSIESRLFTDVDESNPYYTAVRYLVEKGTVQGYEDETYRGTNTVTRTEALKFIFDGLDQEVLDGVGLNFTDAFDGKWYSKFLATAQHIGIVKGYSDGSFKPSQGVNRAEFLTMLFNTVDISIDPVVLEDPYDDVDNLSWYAPVVQYAKQKNVFPVEGNNFEASKEINRYEVAELIYRLIVVLQNEGEPYSILLPVN